MQFIRKADYRKQLASGKSAKTVAVLEAAPQALLTGRGTLVSTAHLLARPTGAMQKLGAEVIVFGTYQPPLVAPGNDQK